MAEGPGHALDRDAGRDEARGRILRFVQVAERRRWPGRPRRGFTVEELAARLELDRVACCRALYQLVHCGDLEVDRRPDGRFALRLGPNVRS